MRLRACGEAARVHACPSFERPTYFEPRPERVQTALPGMQATVRMPCNPRGRTGISGRGKLPSYGPNHEVAVVVTR